MLEAINLECVRGERRLFCNLSFAAGPGELIEVRGANGSGKTSLLRILCGLAAPAAGEVKWKNQSLRSLGEEYSAEIAYLAHQNGVKDELTAFENLRISSGLQGCSLNKQEASEFLAEVGLADYADLPARVLSAGQRRRLALARLLASEATVWILDELLTSLDTAAMALSRKIISDHLNNGGLAIVATHQELELAVPGSQRIDLRR